MRSITYAKLAVWSAASLGLLHGCDGTPGGTLTGGGTGSIYPSLIHAVSSPLNVVSGLRFAGDASNVTFVSDDNVLLTNPDENEQIFNLELSGSRLTQITAEPASAIASFASYDISDDGDWIVFTTTDDVSGDNPTGSANLFLAKADGSSVAQVTRNTVGGLTSYISEPQMAADASRIFFISNIDLDAGKNPGGVPQIFSINADGSGLTQITNGHYSPEKLALADGGSRIAFQGTGDPFGSNGDFSREIFVINPKGTGDAQLTSGERGSFEPRISDDGGLVVFASRDDLVTGGNIDASLEIFVARGDGTGITQITSSEKDSGRYGSSSGPGSFDISGNGAYIVFNSLADLTGENPDAWNALFWAGSDGANLTQLLRTDTVPANVSSRQGTDPKIDNDGGVIVFAGTANFDPDHPAVGDKIFRMNRQ